MNNEYYMKRLFVLLIGAMMVSAIQAQVLDEGESALVYYSPKTTVSLNFEYTVETYEAGIYAQYAEDMLGATEVIMENKKVYTLKDVHIGTKTETDYSRPHKVALEIGFPVLLNINDKGLLTGYNVSPTDKKDTPKHDNNKSAGKFKKNNYPSVAPYPEEVLKATSPQAQAFEAAKQVFHIRETRMYLLSGEVEHAPADGEAMKMVLDELDKQERELTELFVGKKSKKCEQKTVRVEPSDEKQLLFFSEENGFTDSENIDADTIEVRMLCQPQVAKPIAGKQKKGAELSQIVYNIPGYCEVNIFYKGRSMAGRTILVAQLGADVALPKSLFTGKELPKIIFDEKTGNIISISK